jgi:hypothetical protein
MAVICSKKFSRCTQGLSDEVSQKGTLGHLAIYAYGFAVVVRVPE